MGGGLTEPPPPPWVKVWVKKQLGRTRIKLNAANAVADDRIRFNEYGIGFLCKRFST